MKKLSKRISSIIFAFLIASACIGVAACGETPPPPPPEPTELVLDYSGVKTEFEYGEAFTYAGLKIEVVMSDGEREELPLGSAEIKPPQMTPGQHMVEVSYGELSKKYPIYVNDLKKPYDDSVLMNITGSGVFTAQAEKIDLKKCETVPADEGIGFVKRTNSALIGGGAYLMNYGVKDNCVGFAFTSAKDYSDITLAFTFGNTYSEALTLADTIKIYCNFDGSYDTGELDISSFAPIASGRFETVAVSGVPVHKGENNLIIEVVGDRAPVLDSVKAVVGTPAHVDSSLDLSDEGPAVIEAELMNTEKLVNDAAVASENKLAPCQPYVTEYDGGARVSGFVSGTEFSTVLVTESESVYRAEMKIDAENGYGVKDNWQFMIDDCVLADVADPIADNVADLGEYKLAAGRHLFRARLVGEGCALDNFTFTALEDADKPVIEDNTNSDLMVYANGSYRVEAEKMLDRSGWVPQFGTVDGMIENWYHADGSKGNCVSKVKVGTVMRVSFKLKHQAKFTLKARVCKDGSPNINPTDFATTLNGTAMKWSTSDTFGHSDATNWWKWGTLDYASSLLEAGEYTVAVSVTDVGVDYFELAFEEPTDIVVTDYKTYKAEAEELFDRSGWVPQFGTVDEMIETWWHNDGNKGSCVGKVKAGTVMRMTVKFDKRTRLALSASVCRNGGAISASDMVTKIGETSMVWRTTDLFGSADGKNYWNWGTVSYEPVVVEAGTHVITITTVDVGYDYFTLECSDPAADLVISDFGTYKFEAEDMLDRSGWKAQSGNTVAQMVEKWNHKDGTVGYCVGKTVVGHIYRMTLKIDKPCSLSMRASICRDGGDIWNSNFNLSIGGTACKFIKEDTNFKFGHDDAKNYWNWGTVRWDAVNLEAGVIAVEIVSANQFSANVDWFEFTAAEPLPAPETQA